MRHVVDYYLKNWVVFGCAHVKNGIGTVGENSEKLRRILNNFIRMHFPSRCSK